MRPSSAVLPSMLCCAVPCCAVLCRAVSQVYMEACDYNALISACIQHGDASSGGDPQLWAEALEYLSTQPGQTLHHTHSLVANSCCCCCCEAWMLFTSASTWWQLPLWQMQMTCLHTAYM